MRLLTAERTFSLAAAPSIWFVHFVAVYMLASFACSAGAIAEMSPFRVSASGVALLTLAGLALSGYAAAANLRKLRKRRRHATEDMSSTFLARTNALLHTLAMIAMLWAALPAFFLSPCAT